jgi:AcrR family transcriptional regulator
MDGSPPRGARELARRAVAAQVAETALDLFLKDGYEQTTVDDICAAAGISRSTFFRYFATKEAVFTGQTAAVPQELLQALEERPDDEAPWTALGHALGPLIERYGLSHERAVQLARLGRTTPVLAMLNREKLANSLTLLTPEVCRRLGADPDDTTDPRPHALIAAAFSCLDATIAVWTAGDGTQSLTETLHRAMNAIHS